MKANCELQKYLSNGTKIHLVGIGGVSMSALAEVLKDRGIDVTGSDMNVSETVVRLRGRGIPVFEGHFASNLGDCACVIRTAAAKDDNPEIAAAREQGIPVFERAEAWGVIMADYRNAVCFSGTHGKTTSSSMCTQIFMEAGLDPTVMIGGTVPLLGSGYRVGKGDTMVAEACEYCDSFLNFCPTVAVINNVEADHLDYFADLEAIKKSFIRFAELIPESGFALINCDDPGAADVAGRLARKPVAYGFSENADVRGANYSLENNRPCFDIYFEGELYAHIELSVPGRHNAYNALAACGAAALLGVPGSVAAEALAHFVSADRRLQFKGRFNGADVYDDYAHHPGELKALFDAVLAMDYKRVICVFQPHTYSRTLKLLDEFAEQLRRPQAVLLAKIYAAREKDVFGISSADLAAKVPGALYYESFAGIADRLKKNVVQGDLILTVGAGDVYKIGEELVK